MTDPIDEFLARRLIADSTDIDRLRGELRAGPMVLYCGFDPTAPSLHLGNLVQLVTLRRFQQAGHRPLALVGGATGLIGDPKPTGERTLNPADQVAEWVEKIRSQVERFLDFEGPSAARVVNNYEWTSTLDTITFLRDVGKHFSVNRMLDRESVKARLEGAGISYTEFSYQLLQAHDYLELHRRYGCRLQTGGSDQWGNLTAGVDLIRRVTGEHVNALSTPLLTKADGTKFGKTESGTVWLDPTITSPYAFYQFWLNCDDAEVPSLLRTFSSKPVEEIEQILADSAARPHARTGQRALADEATALVHGPDQLAAVQSASAALFGGGDVRALDGQTLGAALREAPHAQITPAELRAEGGFAVAEALALVGLVPSKNAGRRTITEGGAYVNNERVSAVDAVIDDSDLLAGNWVLLRRGRKTLGGLKVAAEPL